MIEGDLVCKQGATEEVVKEDTSVAFDENCIVSPLMDAKKLSNVVPVFPEDVVRAVD